MDSDEETAVTDIIIQPDGRIFVFGLSREVADVLEELCPKEHPIRRVSSSATQDTRALSH